MRLANSLRPNKQETKGLRHRIFFDKLLRNDFRPFDGAVRRTENVEILELTMGVTLRDLRAGKKTLRPGTRYTFTASHAFYALTCNSYPTGIVANRTHGPHS